MLRTMFKILNHPESCIHENIIKITHENEGAGIVAMKTKTSIFFTGFKAQDRMNHKFLKTRFTGSY